MLEFNSQNRSIFLTGRITVQKSTELISKLLLFESKNKKPIKLFINSEGGVIEPGLFAIYDIIQSLQSTVKTFCLGESFSSAAILVASGAPRERYIFPHATMMLHPPQTELNGTKDEIKQELKALSLIDSKFWGILAKHTGQKKSTLISDCQNDKYFSATEAIKYGLADFIVSPAKKKR